jgi:hypothetical protein
MQLTGLFVGSSPHPLSPPPNNPHPPAPTTYPLPQCNTPPIPVNTPASPHRQGPDIIPRSVMGGARGLE